MIKFRKVTKRFGGWTAVDELSLTVEEGELCVLIGPSGSGKSTALRLVNRLIEPTSGQVLVGGKPVEGIAPEQLRRHIGYVIQSVGLFPHWTVERNIATVPRLLGWPAERIRARVEALLALLHLDEAQIRGKYPHELSGGQQQRIGVARALAGDPSVLLMDEPFAALDPLTRASLQEELVRIHRETGKTILFVTHDMDEALQLGTRIVLMDRGRLIQQGRPREILADPANEFVGRFVGNRLRGLKLLAMDTVGSRLRAGERVAGDPVELSTPLHEALSLMVLRGTDRLAVVDGRGRPVGALHLTDLPRQ